MRQLGDELQDSARGRPRLLEISARLQQTRYDGGGNAPPLHVPLSAVGAARQLAQSAAWAGPLFLTLTPTPTPNPNPNLGMGRGSPRLLRAR